MRGVLFGGTVKYSRYILYLFIYFFSFSKKRIHYVDFNKKIKNNKTSRIKRPINIVKPILSIGIGIYIMYIIVFSTATPAEYSRPFVGFVFTTVFRDLL